MIIGIVAHEKTQDFMYELLRSMLGIKYPVYVVYNNKGDRGLVDSAPFGFEFPVLFNPQGGYELGALSAMMEYFTEEDDFFLLHATTLIKDKRLFDIAAQFDGSLAICPGFASFMGKYRRKVLEEVGIPVPQSREAAIYYEYFWNIMYMDLEKKIASIDQPLKDTDVFEKKFGQKRMVLENDYMKKWKSNHGGFKIKIPV